VCSSDLARTPGAPGPDRKEPPAMPKLPRTDPNRHAYSRLASLRETLSGQGFETRLEIASLIVIDKPDGGPCLADTITCREREDDEGRLWFYTSWGDPVAEVDRVTDAAVIIAGNLQPKR